MNIEKIKVLVICLNYPPMYSGAGLRAYRTYKRLQKSYNICPLVITPQLNKYHNNGSNYNEIKTHRIKNKKGILQNLIILYNLFKKKEFRSYHIVHCYGTGSLNIAAGLCAILFSKKLIVEQTVNNSSIQRGIINELRKIILYFRRTFIQRIVQRKADMLIALKNTYKDEYIGIGVQQNKIWLRPNPVDTNLFYYPSMEEREKARKLLGIDNKHFIHLMIGNISPNKNQLFSMGYIKMLPNNHILLIVGPTLQKDRNYLEKIIEIVKDNSLYDKVKIINGYVSNIVQYYHASDLFIVPSFSEGLPNVLLEALCCGLPAFVNEELGLNNIVRNNENGMNLPLNHKIFAQYTQEYEWMYNDNNIRKSISARANELFGYSQHDKEHAEKLNKLFKN
jgi:glycosyltransferase involved in cell wall biosynthesis